MRKIFGKEVEVYRNLNKGGWFSVRDRKTKRVIAHAEAVVLYDVTFHVQEGSRKKVLRDGRKNVHAWVRGVFINGADMKLVFKKKFKYDPYIAGYFYDSKTKRPLDDAEYVVLTDVGGFYIA